MYLFTGYENNSKFVVLQNSNYFEGNLLEIVNVEVDKELAIVLIAIKYISYYMKENLINLSVMQIIMRWSTNWSYRTLYLM